MKITERTITRQVLPIYTGLASTGLTISYSGIPELFGLSFGTTSFRRVQERDSARATLEGISSLLPNWDGHGSLQISKEAIEHTRRFLLILTTETPTLINPEITPTPSGTIALEWETDTGEAYLEIGKTRFSFFARSGHYPETVRDGLAEAIDGSLLELVQNLLFSGWPQTAPTYPSLSQVLSWQIFESDFVAPITNALASTQAYLAGVNQFSMPDLIWQTYEGALADPITYSPLGDLADTIHSTPISALAA